METRKLGTIASIRLGLQASTDSNGAIPMIRVGDLNRPINWLHVEATSAARATEADLQIQDGDVLIARSGEGSVGNLQVVVSPPRSATFASYVLRLRPNPGWYGKYIAYWLKTKTGRQQLQDRVVGSPISNLSAQRLMDLDVPDASWNEQCQIGDRLHEAYLLMTETRERLEAALSTLSIIRPAAFFPTEAELSADRIPYVPLEEITDNQDRNRVPLNARQRRENPGPTPYYGASGVIDHVSGNTHMGRYVLVSEDGNNLRTRKTPIAFAVDGEFWANNHVHVLQPLDPSVSEYLALAIDALPLLDSLSGSAQPKLNQAALSKLQVPMPGIVLQNQIVEHVERSFRQLQDLTSLGSAALVSLQSSWDEILSSSFGSRKSTDRVLSVDAALDWLDTAQATLDLRGKEAKDSHGEQLNSESAEHEVNDRLSIEMLFEAKRAEFGWQEAEEAVDLFYEWLRTETLERRMVVVLGEDGAYIRSQQ